MKVGLSRSVFRPAFLTYPSFFCCLSFFALLACFAQTQEGLPHTAGELFRVLSLANLSASLFAPGCAVGGYYDVYIMVQCLPLMVCTAKEAGRWHLRRLNFCGKIVIILYSRIFNPFLSLSLHPSSFSRPPRNPLLSSLLPPLRLPLLPLKRAVVNP